MANSAVCIAHSQKLLALSDLNPRTAGRSKLVYALMSAYGLLGKARVLQPPPATKRQLQTFHSADFIDFLQANNECDHDDLSDEAKQFGLGYDCPIFSGMYDYVGVIAGSSLAMASTLVSGECLVGINWYGGWHHSKKSEAAGFCYCNDIVLAILHLLTRFERVLYIDLDVHHGDGVEEAFWFSNKVMTVSFHKYSPGFFPGTGSVDSIGACSGRHYAINVPLDDGITDDLYRATFSAVISEVRSRFKPSAIVLQCGADSLSGDPLGTFCLSLRGIGACVSTVLDWKLPTLLLGGGGYNFPNTARLWTYCTALALGEELDNDIPEHEWYDQYGADYKLHLTPANRQNKNTQSQIDELLQTISGRLANV